MTATTLRQIRRRRAEDAARVAAAAALLDTTEFQLFALAWRHWYGRPAGEAELERWYVPYMFEDRVPVWVRDYVRGIERAAASGTLDRRDYPETLQPPATPRRRRLGLEGLALIVLLLAFLLWLAQHVAGLLGLVESCYFPPCL